MKTNIIKLALIKTLKMFKISLPIIIGVLLLVNLLNVIFQEKYENIFTGNVLFDPLIGSLAGSISFGIPIVSYVTGGELLAQGVSLLAVTAFVMAWSTVGIAMLPLEAKFLGWRFALARNIINFIFSILIAVLTVFTVQ